MFKAIVFGIIEFFFLFIIIVLLNRIPESCDPILFIVIYCFVACVLSVAAHGVQICVVAVATIFGKYNINSFTIGMDLGGFFVAVTAFVSAVTTKKTYSVMSSLVESVIFVACFLIFAFFFARSKDYAKRMLKVHKEKQRKICLLNRGVWDLKKKPATRRRPLNPFYCFQFLLYLQTFTIYPGTLLSVVPYDKSKEVWFHSLTVFVNFSFWALFVSIVCHYIHSKIFLNKTHILSGVVITRFIIIGLLYLGTNYKPDKPRPKTLFDPFIGDWVYFFLISLFAITHSFVASMADIAVGYEGKNTPSSKRGEKLVIIKNVGIYSGLAINMLLNKIY